MSAIQIIRAIEDIGGEIIVHNGGLKLAAAKGKITPDMLAAMKTYKAEIINLITRKNKLTDYDQNAELRPPGTLILEHFNSGVGLISTRFVSTPLSDNGTLKSCPLPAVTVSVASEKPLEEPAQQPISFQTDENLAEPIRLESLLPCPVCGGYIFNESIRGGFFCVICQPLPFEDIKLRVEGQRPARVSGNPCKYCGNNKYIGVPQSWLCLNCWDVSDFIGNSHEINIIERGFVPNLGLTQKQQFDASKSYI